MADQGDQQGYGGDQQSTRGGYGGSDQYASGQTGGDGFGSSDPSTTDPRLRKTNLTRRSIRGMRRDSGSVASLKVDLRRTRAMKQSNPEHARRHKLEEEGAAGAGVASEGGALYERHEKKDDATQVADDEGGKKHGWFS